MGQQAGHSFSAAPGPLGTRRKGVIPFQWSPMGLQVPELQNDHRSVFHRPSFDLGLDYKANRPQHCHMTPTYPSSLHCVSQKIVLIRQNRGTPGCRRETEPAVGAFHPNPAENGGRTSTLGVRPFIETRAGQTVGL